MPAERLCAAILFAIAIIFILPGCIEQAGNTTGPSAMNKAQGLSHEPANASSVPEMVQLNIIRVQPPTNSVVRPSGKEEEHGSYLLFVPDRPNLQNDSIFIVAFSPSGDANSMIGAWRDAAEKRGWPVFASKTFHNGADLPVSFNNDTFSDIGDASLKLGYAQPKLVFTGFSGGGQVSHAFAFGSPGKVAAVVTNCGIINRGFLNYTRYYPRNKTVLFIASPTDFRYNDMKDDKAYLEDIGWKTGWIEFSGGHMLAPPGTYEQAAEWLEQEIGSAANKTK
jgi:hypothetical protein